MLLPLRLQSVHDSCATNTLCWKREMSENENLLHGPSNNILNIVLDYQKRTDFSKILIVMISLNQKNSQDQIPPEFYSNTN